MYLNVSAYIPEMKKDILCNICLSVEIDGEITAASCGCPAGAGPKGSCKHIAAFSFSLEEFCGMKWLRSPQSCTSELQKWNQPHKRKLESCSIEDIDPFHQARVYKIIDHQLEHILSNNISHLPYLYYRASWGFTRIISLPEGYKGNYGS